MAVNVTGETYQEIDQLDASRDEASPAFHLGGGFGPPLAVLKRLPQQQLHLVGDEAGNRVEPHPLQPLGLAP